jgi:hypothetical protein
MAAINSGQLIGFFVSARMRAAAAKALSFWEGAAAEDFAAFFLIGAVLALERVGLLVFEAGILAGMIGLLGKAEASRLSRRRQHSYLDRQPTSSSFGIIFRVWRGTQKKDLAEPSLAAPIPGATQGLKIRQVQAFSALVKGRQEEKLFLDVGSKVEQIENLADARPADLAQARQLRLMGNGPTTKQPFQAQGQGHESSQTRNASVTGR